MANTATSIRDTTNKAIIERFFQKELLIERQIKPHTKDMPIDMPCFLAWYHASPYLMVDSMIEAEVTAIKPMHNKITETIKIHLSMPCFCSIAVYLAFANFYIKTTKYKVTQ